MIYMVQNAKIVRFRIVFIGESDFIFSIFLRVRGIAIDAMFFFETCRCNDLALVIG
jgi:hypothetical protein